MKNLIEVISGFILGLAVLTPILLKARKALKEVGELLVKLSSALDDGKITVVELKEIVSEGKDILGVFGKK
jgi:hypothetical protein